MRVCESKHFLLADFSASRPLCRHCERRRCARSLAETHDYAHKFDSQVYGARGYVRRHCESCVFLLATFRLINRRSFFDYCRFRCLGQFSILRMLNEPTKNAVY